MLVLGATVPPLSPLYTGAAPTDSYSKFGLIAVGHTEHEMKQETREREAMTSLGPPALRIAGLQLWIHGRQFPDSNDPDDGNWLRVTAHCGASGASVWAEGPILMTSDLDRWAEQCEGLHRGRLREASLSPLEPELEVALRAYDQVGHVRMQVKITPDHMNQEHEFSFELDQSYLPELVTQCRAIVEKYPVRK